MNNLTVLKACPFCGGKARLKKGFPYQQRPNHLKMALIQCRKCGCRTPLVYQQPYQAWEDCLKYLVEKWNTRVFLDPPARLLTDEDFAPDNPVLGCYGYRPAWCEYRDPNRGGEWFIVCNFDVLLTRKDNRYWTAKPTEEQRRATPWPIS